MYDLQLLVNLLRVNWCLPRKNGWFYRVRSMTSPQNEKNMALPVTRTPISGYLKVSNQTNSTPVYIRLINQSNRSISVRLFAHFHIKVIRKSLYLLRTSVWNHDGDDDGDGRVNVENTTGLDPVYTGLDKCFNGKIFSRASRLHGTVQIPLQIAALFALQKLMQGLAGPCKRKANQCNFFFRLKIFPDPC